MTKQEAEKLITVIRECVDHPMPTGPVNVKGFEKNGTKLPGEMPAMRLTVEEQNDLYQMFRRRFIDEAKTDTVLLHLMAIRPEILLEFEPQVVKLDASTLRGRLARLLADGFFESGRRQGEARTELTRTGSEPNSGQLSTLFSEFVRDGFLERTAGDRYMKAAGLTITTKAVETTR